MKRLVFIQRSEKRETLSWLELELCKGSAQASYSERLKKRVDTTIISTRQSHEIASLSLQWQPLQCQLIYAVRYKKGRGRSNELLNDITYWFNRNYFWNESYNKSKLLTVLPKTAGGNKWHSCVFTSIRQGAWAASPVLLRVRIGMILMPGPFTGCGYAK